MSRRVVGDDGEFGWEAAPELPSPTSDRCRDWTEHDQICGLGWVYTLYGDNDEPLYVGVSMNPLGRVKSHHSKPWWHEVRRVGYQTVYDLDRYAEERARIEALQPKYNRLRCHHLVRA